MEWPARYVQRSPSTSLRHLAIHFLDLAILDHDGRHRLRVTRRGEVDPSLDGHLCAAARILALRIGLADFHLHFTFAHPRRDIDEDVFGAVDLAGAIWTWLALKKEK